MNGNGKTGGESSAPPDGAQAASPLARHLRELTAEVEALKAAGPDSPADTLAHWLAAHYTAAARKVAEQAGDDGIPLATLRILIADTVALRKGDHSAARLRQEQEWLEIERGKSDEQMQKRFEEWAKNPANRDRFFDKNLSLEERQRKIREIFGMQEPLKRGLSPETLAEIERAARLL